MLRFFVNGILNRELFDYCCISSFAFYQTANARIQIAVGLFFLIFRVHLLILFYICKKIHSLNFFPSQYP